MSGIGSFKTRKQCYVAKGVDFLFFFWIYHVKPENFEHGTRRVDKLLFSMGNVFNSALVDIGQSQEFLFFGHCVQKICLRTASMVAYVLPP